MTHWVVTGSTKTNEIRRELIAYDIPSNSRLNMSTLIAEHRRNPPCTIIEPDSTDNSANGNAVLDEPDITYWVTCRNRND